MSGLRAEIVVFRRCSRSMQILLLANMVYAFVFPVLEIFVSAYVMRNSHDESRVFTYQLSLYAAMPPAFLLNGILLGRVAAKHLYAAGMVLSGVAMMMLMQSGVLTLAGIAAAGFAMGMATGLFWANRGFLALATTEDCNRNYYYGLELFIAMLASIVVPALVGWFISGASLYGWSGEPRTALIVWSPSVCLRLRCSPPGWWSVVRFAIRPRRVFSTSVSIPCGGAC